MPMLAVFFIRDTRWRRGGNECGGGSLLPETTRGDTVMGYEDGGGGGGGGGRCGVGGADA